MQKERLQKRIARGKYKDKLSESRAKNALYVSELKNRATKEEKIVFEYLIEKDVNFRFQKGFIKPFHRIVDFYIPKKKIIIEVDGKYHDEIVVRDQLKDITWMSMGYQTIRILNADVNSGKFKPLLDFLF